MAQPQPARAAPRYLTATYLVLTWTLVGAPLAWGVYETLIKSLLLFR